MTESVSLRISTPSDREVAFRCSFNALAERVFDAITIPDQIRQWMGPREWELSTCEVDLRVGGAYRYAGPLSDGSEMGWGGVFTEVKRPTRLVHTEKFDQPWYPGEALIAVDLIESEGATELVMTIQYESKDARDAVLKTPMSEGMGISYTRLAELLDRNSVD